MIRRSPRGPAPGVLTALLLTVAAVCAPGRAASGQDASFRAGDPVRVSAARPATVHVEPTVAVSPRDPDRMVAAAMVVDSPRAERWHDSQRVVVYASRDGGRSWRARPLPGLPEGWMSGDPWLVWTSGDVVYLSCIVSESLLEGKPASVRVFRSEDGGWSWSEPMQVFPPGTTQDHPVLASADGPDGRPRVYAFGSSADEDDGVDVAELEAGTDRFRPLPTFRPDTTQVNLGSGVVLPGEERVAFTWYRMGARPWGFRAVADDGGGRWRSVPLREGILPVGFPMLAVDRSGGERRGRLYAVWVEGSDPLDAGSPRVLLARSDDGGRSWSGPTRVDRGPPTSLRSMPNVAVDAEGVVGVTWLDGRHRPERSDCPAVYFAASKDGGATFRPEVRLDGPACFGTAANGVAARRWRLGGGEYHGLAAAPDGSFRVVWPGSGTGVFQIWTAAVRPPGT